MTWPAPKSQDRTMPVATGHALLDAARAFEALEEPDRIDALVEYGRFVPDLPPPYRALRDAGIGIVTECASPVFILGEADSGRLRVHADAPREAPIARGFVGLLVYVYHDAPLARLQAAPASILDELHLTSVLSMRRIRGLTGIYRQLRSVVDEPVGSPGSPQ